MAIKDPKTIQPIFTYFNTKDKRPKKEALIKNMFLDSLKQTENSEAKTAEFNQKKVCVFLNTRENARLLVTPDKLKTSHFSRKPTNHWNLLSTSLKLGLTAPIGVI